MTITLDGTTGITTPGLTNTGTETIAALSVSGAVTLSGGTANGVGYLNGSKVLTTGSALTYNGTGLGIGVASASNPLHIDFDGTAARIVRGSAIGFIYNTGTTSTSSFRIQSNTGPVDIYTASGQPITFSAEAAEQMRLTSTGLGIGTSSPGYKLEVSGSSYLNGNILTQAGATFYNSTGDLFIRAGTSGLLRLGAGGTNSFAILDASGNLLVGGTALIATEKLLVQNDANSSTYIRVRNSNAGASAASAIALNAYGNTWGIECGSSAKNSNSLTFTLDYGGTNAEKMRLDTSGNLGIGTSSPSSRLNVDGGSLATSGVGILAAGSISTGRLISGGGTTVNAVHTYYDDRAYELSAGSTSGYVSGIAIGARSYSGTGGDAVTIWTRSAERARIDSSGNLLVGTTSTGYTSSNSTYYTPTAAYWINNHATGTASGTRYVGFGIGVNEVGSITQSGTTAVLYNTTSDRRLKDNITDADSASELIDAIKVRQFDWKSDGSHQRYGMIAQELHEVAPEAVHSPVDPDEMMAVDYSKLVPMLVKEIQSLRVRLNALESK